MSGLRAGSAIAGAAESDLGAVADGMRPVDLMAQASMRALADCGLAPGDVDGLFAATTQLPMAPLNLARELGIRPRYTDATNVGGSSFMFHVNHARAAIAAGLCEVALIAYGSTQRLVGRGERVACQELDPWEAPYRPAMPVTAYALAAARHMHEFGTTREQLAEVAVAARAWAAAQPGAPGRASRSASTTCSASRMVADPLTRPRLLPGHRRRRRDRRHLRRARARRCGARRCSCSAPARPTATATSPAWATSRGRPRRSPARAPSRRPGSRRPTSTCVAALRRLHDHADPVPRGPRLLRQGRGRRRSSRAAGRPRAARCP